MSAPTSSRPEMPDGYGIPEASDGLLPWAVVEDRLRASKHYWRFTF